jgi:Type II CAAX prenyl endopeptidase Rce1-like
MILTPILRRDPYILATMFLLGISSTSIAAYATTRWLKSVRFNYYFVYALLLSALSLAGRLLFNPSLFPLLGRNVSLQVLAICIAAAVGAFLSHLTERVVRGRRPSAQIRHGVSVRRAYGDTPSSLIKSRGFQVEEKRRATVTGNSDLDQKLKAKIKIQGLQLTPLLVIGIGEEVLYRGVLGDIAWDQNSVFWRSALLAIAIIAFSLSHIWFGIREVIYKLPLSIVAFTVTIVTMSLLPAIIMHVTYNAVIWFRINRRGAPIQNIERHI